VSTRRRSLTWGIRGTPSSAQGAQSKKSATTAQKAKLEQFDLRTDLSRAVAAHAIKSLMRNGWKTNETIERLYGRGEKAETPKKDEG